MLAEWVEKHKAKTPGNRALQHQLDEWMEQWETSEKERHDSAAAAATDEGWTVVTKQRVSLARKLCQMFILSRCGHAQALQLLCILHRAEKRAPTRAAHQLALLWRLLQPLPSQGRLRSS